jgi:hypothetical protein
MAKSTYNAKKSKAKKNRGLHKTSYSDFWLHDRYNYLSKYEQEREDQSAAIFTKAIKLHAQQRAIANFVKIVTNKDIPVRFAGGTSYTNGEAVTISADIKDKTFDVSVGLALHEASHIILSDMKGWTEYLENFKNEHTLSEYNFFKSLSNWLEDRRIDNTIFKSSPGYKAYYHKLYDYYWNDDTINKALLSDECRDPQIYDHWLFNIINSMSPFYNVNRMKGLKDVMSILDIQNIDRLKSTADVINVVEKAFAAVQSIAKQPLEVEDKNARTTNNENPTSESEQNDTTQNETKMNVQPEDIEDDTNNNDNVDPFSATETLDATQKGQIQRTFQKQVDLLNNKVEKKNIDKNLAEPLEAFDGQGGKLVQLEDAFLKPKGKGGTGKKHNAPGYFTDLTKSPLYSTYVDHLQTMYMNGTTEADKYKWKTKVTNDLYKINPKLHVFYNPGYCKVNAAAIHDGLNMGGLIANKLRTHGESRDRVDNRQLTGTLDRRRIAHLGYGVESVFQRINIQRNKPAHIHLTIDGSGSMNEGEKWPATIRLAVAIARGIQGKSHLSMSVSVRVNASELFSASNTILRGAPAVAVIWDSRAGLSPTALGVLLSNINFSSSTPEGLCYDILHKAGYITPGSDAMDSYIVNISDGAPNWPSNYTSDLNVTDGRQYYCKEMVYVNKWWKKLITTYNLKGLSYYIRSSQYGHSSTMESYFKYMYGNEATTTDTKNAMAISQTINKMLIKSTANVLV